VNAGSMGHAYSCNCSPSARMQEPDRLPSSQLQHPRRPPDWSPTPPCTLQNPFQPGLKPSASTCTLATSIQARGPGSAVACHQRQGAPRHVPRSPISATPRRLTCMSHAMIMLWLSLTGMYSCAAARAPPNFPCALQRGYVQVKEREHVLATVVTMLHLLFCTEQ
jgi:hypothetical protein